MRIRWNALDAAAILLLLAACSGGGSDETLVSIYENGSVVRVTREEISKRLSDGRLTLVSQVATDSEWIPIGKMDRFEEIVRAATFPWPPRVGEPYPDLILRNHKGEWVQLSSLKGKPILLEPIGMNCPACIAFSGGNHPSIGTFQGFSPEGGVPSLEERLAEGAEGLRVDDPNFAYVQLLLYSPGMKAPTQEEAAAWVDHFQLERYQNFTALFGDERYINQASYDMIPGFQLIDSEFILRVDNSGHQPKHAFWELASTLRGQVYP